MNRIIDNNFYDKIYKVGFIPPEFKYRNDVALVFIIGELLNYNNGNIIISNDKGVYHIPYGAIKWLIPIKEVEEND